MPRTPPKIPRIAARHLHALLGGIPLPQAQHRAVSRTAGHTTHIWVINIFTGPASAGAFPAVPPAADGLTPIASPAVAPPPPWTASPPPEEAGNDDPLSVLARTAIRTAIASHSPTSTRPAWATLGLPAWEFNSLRDALGSDTMGTDTADANTPTDAPAETASALLEWLWSFRGSDSALTRAVCAALACASLRPRHLWEELGLAGRDPLNRLLAGHLHALYRRNLTHMGWKKFILLQYAAASTAARAGVPVVPPR